MSAYRTTGILEGPVQKRRLSRRLPASAESGLLCGEAIARHLEAFVPARVQRQRDIGKMRAIGVKVENDIKKLRHHPVGSLSR